MRQSITSRLVDLYKKAEDHPINEQDEGDDLFEQAKNHPRFKKWSEEQIKSMLQDPVYKRTMVSWMRPDPTPEEIAENRKTNPILRQIYEGVEQRREASRVHGEKGEEKVPRSREVRDKNLDDHLRYFFGNEGGKAPVPTTPEAWEGVKTENEPGGFTPGIKDVVRGTPGASNEMSRRMNAEMVARLKSGPQSDPSGREDKGIFEKKLQKMHNGLYNIMKGKKNVSCVCNI